MTHYHHHNWPDFVIRGPTDITIVPRDVEMPITLRRARKYIEVEIGDRVVVEIDPDDFVAILPPTTREGGRA